MKRIYTSFLLVGAIALFSGCQSFTDYVVETGQPDAEEAPHAHACKADLARTADGQSAGQLVVRPGNLCVNVEGQLIGLPPTADLTITIRRNHAPSAEQAGHMVNVSGTNFTGLVGPIRTSTSGTASVRLSTNNVTFTNETIIGRGLCITDADGNLVASGVLGISELH